MKKDNLKTGMKVLTNTDKEYIVLLNVEYNFYNHYKNILINPLKDSHDWYDMDEFDNNLEIKDILIKINKIYS
jgi:hypothetical protein